MQLSHTNKATKKFRYMNVTQNKTNMTLSIKE